MGTLDDAIREHLELKKRAGASEEELQRLESEAFGPIRREPVAPAAAAPEESAGEHPLPDPEEPDEGSERRDFDLPPDVEPGHDPPPDAPPPSPSAPPPASEASSTWLEDDDDDEPATPEQATSEFTAAEAADAQGAPASDYVAPDEE